MKKIGGGRTAAWEIMVATPAIRNLIREHKLAQMYSSVQTGQADGMQTMDQHLRQLVDRGIITSETARGRAENKEDF
jgi:twitching motility protein PilT